MPGANDYEPYEPNAKGLVGILIDFKNTISFEQVYNVAGFIAPAFENVSQGEALYSRSSDGKVGRAIANDTLDKATVIGFAETTKTTGQAVRCVTYGTLASSGLTPGASYFLSAGGLGGITSTAPTGDGNFLTRVGKASKTAELIVHLEAPIIMN